MNIEKIVFEFRETKTYVLTVSAENGWDMPETGNRLVELVNEIKNQPHKFISDSECEMNYDTECVASEIIEGLSK
ncbi:MAG: hypothetical protein MJK15_03935 [Colwellia sp.]|nr:hypothetical protein [Colwellia sp.]